MRSLISLFNVESGGDAADSAESKGEKAPVEKHDEEVQNFQQEFKRRRRGRGSGNRTETMTAEKIGAESDTAVTRKKVVAKKYGKYYICVKGDHAVPPWTHG